jgi:hypothetical protein
MTVTPIDTGAMAYGIDYDLGTIVTAVVEGVPLREAIREIRISLTPDGPQRIVPVIGTPGRHDVLAVFRRLAGLSTRMTNLERR